MAIIAIDFDGVIVEDNFPDTNFVVRLDIRSKAMLLQSMGHKFILWTCREGHHLHDALDWLSGNMYPIDFIAINSEPEEMSVKTRLFWKKEYRRSFFQRKVNADYYIDDKSPGSVEWFLNWDGNDTAGDRRSCGG